MSTSESPWRPPLRTLEGMVFTDDLRSAVHRRPDHTAIRDEHTTLSYRGLWHAATALAGGLATTGVNAGDHVLTMLDNSADYVVTVIAVNFLGAVVVPVNTMYKGVILEHVVRDSRATAAVVEARHLSVLLTAGAGTLQAVVVRGEATDQIDQHDATNPTPLGTATVPLADLRRATPVEPVVRHAWDPLMVGYTSGTTGTSKGVVLSNAYCLAVSDPTEVLRVVGDDHVFYVVCPMFHLTGMAGGLFASVAAAGTMHIASSFSARSFAKDATEAGATCCNLVGTMVDFILRQPERPGDAECSLRTVAMVPVHPRVDEFERRFNVKARTSFGGTESGAVLVAADDIAVARRSCGTARAGFEVRLVDENDLEVPPGEVGEIVARSYRPWLVGGPYLGNPGASAASWRNGWFHTGDLLRQDVDGYFYYVDRAKDSIRRRGENISSLEVEREVTAHPDVLACAAVGVAAEYLEQEVKVFVVKQPGTPLSEVELVEFLIHRLPRYAVPRYVVFVDDMPRTPTGKVRKNVLRALSNDHAWDREVAGIVIPR